MRKLRAPAPEAGCLGGIRDLAAAGRSPSDAVVGLHLVANPHVSGPTPAAPLPSSGFDHPSCQGHGTLSPKWSDDSSQSPATVHDDRTFHELVSELTAQYDRSHAEQRSLKILNDQLVLEVSLLRKQGLCNGHAAGVAQGYSAAGIKVAAHDTDVDGGTDVREAPVQKASPKALRGIIMVPSLLPPAGALPPEPDRPPSPGWLSESCEPRWLQGPEGPLMFGTGGSGKRLSWRQDHSTKDDRRAEEVVEYEVEMLEGDNGRESNVSLASLNSGVSFETSEDCEGGEGAFSVLRVLEYWTRDEEEIASVTAVASRRRTQESHIWTTKTEEVDWCQRTCILTPTGKVAFGWDLFTIVVLLYDLVVIPLQAYPLPDSEFWSFMEFMATVVWTLDFVLSFIRGYEVSGNIELRPKAIIKHYMRTWFVFDFSIVAMDWVTFFISQENVVDMMRFSRVRRALRLMRLARLIKHGQRFMTMFAFIRSENWLVIFRIFWLLTVLVAINHFISCGWYAIGTLGLENSWSEHAFEGFHGFMYRYTTSFHWSVTQFTPASMEIVPKNEYERFYNIVVIHFGLLMFSSFVSNMTNSMTYLTKINYEKRQRQALARTYVVSRGVPLALANDIMRHVAVNQNLRRGLREEDVWAFKNIPKRLLDSMRIEVHRPVLAFHGLFSYAWRTDQDIFARVCLSAIRELAMITGEEVFSAGTPGKSMYFVASGVLRCTSPGYGNVDPPPADILAKQWLCEGTLWVHWEHRGRCTAHSNSCDVTELNAAEFSSIVGRTFLAKPVQEYAQAWARAASLESGGAELVSDYWGQRLRISDLVQKAFKTGDMNDAQKVCRIIGGNEYAIDRVFGAWVKFTRQEKELRDAEAEAERVERRRRRGSFLATQASQSTKEANEEKEERRRRRREARKARATNSGVSSAGSMSS